MVREKKNENGALRAKGVSLAEITEKNYVLLAVLWQEPATETKKPTEEKAAGQAQAGNAGKRTNPVKPTPESLTAGKKTYTVDCEMCHGKEGGGDGDLAG